MSHAPPALTRTEELFFQRVGLAMKAHPDFTIEQAMQAIRADDQRIWETYLTLPDHARSAFQRSLAADIYATIHAHAQEHP